jgi:hypothetical protein
MRGNYLGVLLQRTLGHQALTNIHLFDFKLTQLRPVNLRQSDLSLVGHGHNRARYRICPLLQPQCVNEKHITRPRC